MGITSGIRGDIREAHEQARNLTAAFAGRVLVDNQWIPPESGETFETLDPGTGEPVQAVAAGGKNDVDAAVSSAATALETGEWSRWTGADRARLLIRIADLIDANREELALLECVDQGQPRSYLQGAVDNAANCFRYYASLADQIYGVATEVPSASGPLHAYSRREPVGVVGLITPWNAPLLMVAWKVAPMLAAGCTGVLKPAEDTSLSAMYLGALIVEAGIPPGVLNVVTGPGHTAGQALAESTRVDKISFTGSTATGKHLVSESTINLKRLTLELGGKSPFIVLEDADVRAAALAAAGGIFTNSGQMCSAASRVLVHSSVSEEFEEILVARAKEIVPGHFCDESSDIGPLISAKQRDRVMGYIDSARQDGGTIVVGGEQIDGDGFFVQPTVIKGLSPDARAVREEIFGPVVTMATFESEDEAVNEANNTTYGLAGGVWTRDSTRGQRLARRIRAGRMGINVHAIGDYHLPSGGYKQSGWGREHGPDGLSPYLENKSIFLKL